jgi:polysaccharide biosynthesis protein PslG
MTPKTLISPLLLPLFWAGLSFSSLASDLPRPVFPEGVGVNIHFIRGHEKDLDLIAAAGFKFVRMDFSWGGTEHKKGEYDWTEYDALTANLEKRQLRPVYILDYSNELWEQAVVSRDPISGREHRDTASPQRPESVAAFARWAAAAAAHYRGHSLIWEIWNEPNIGFWKPKPDVKQYIALVQATTAAIRQVHPQATIVAPASSEFPWRFLEELCAAPGVLERLDAISVHPYRDYHRGPETAAADYRRLRGLIERFASPEKQFIPILSGEWGYASHGKGLSLEAQGAFVARQQLANLLYGVPLSIWYDWKNDGPDRNYNEHNFGTVFEDLSPKPAYQAVQTLTRQLAGSRIVRRLGTEKESDYLVLLEDEAGGFKLAAWTTGGSHPVVLDLGLTAKEVSAVDGQGKALMLAEERNGLRLELASAPQYLTAGKASRKLAATACWQLEKPVPTLITSGSPVGVPLWVQVKNPLREPVKETVTLTWPQGSTSAEGTVGVGQNLRHQLLLKPALRSPEELTAKLTVEVREPSGRIIASSSQELNFLLANPIKLALAPAEAGLRVTIQNPSRSPFSGKARVNGNEVPVRLSTGQGELTASIPSPASAASVKISLLDEEGRLAVPDLSLRFQRLNLAACRAALDGDSKVPAQAALVETNAPAGPESPWRKAHRLDYGFEAGWRFVRCAAEGPAIRLEGNPRALGLWVFGDGSGNALRMRITDAGGQTFQPGAPNLDWQGWRWVQFDLADLSRAGHWGGANDGLVHGGLRLDTLLLVDGESRKTSGAIYFAGPALVY